MLNFFAIFGRFYGDIRNKIVIFYYLSSIKKNDKKEVVNKTLIILLRTIIQYIVCHLLNLIIIKVYSTIDYFAFKVVYDFNLSTLFDLFPLPIYENVSLDSNRKTHVVKALHENMRRTIF
jgi:hypothetical protein